MRFFRRFEPEPEPDWVALVAAVDHAADIASPPFMERLGPRWMIVGHPWLTPRQVAQRVADFYTRTWFVESIDAELFALDAALAGIWEPSTGWPVPSRTPGG